MSDHRILIVEDDEHLSAALVTVCQRLGTDPVCCFSGARALEEAARQPPTLVMLDLGLPDMSGLRVLEEIRNAGSVPVVVITAHGSLENVLAAQRLGVENVLIKPLDLALVESTLAQVIRAADERQVQASADPEPAPDMPSTLMVGTSPRMQRVMVHIAQACGSELPALVTGPSGAGKTLAARVIHNHSARRNGPFVALVCSSLPETLVESELFGHERHAFTGAASMRIGHIERARGGTLFLDEIGDLSAAMQAKLLRLLDDQVFHRVGGREDLRLDARIIAATHKNLAVEVKSGRFREDLFFRLRVLEIDLPPLSERIEDIPMLCDLFLAALVQDRKLRLADETRQLLQRYNWPGNIRELRHALEVAVSAASGRYILPSHLPPSVRRSQSAPASQASLPIAIKAWLDTRLTAGTSYDTLHDELEKMLLSEMLERYQGKSTVLARELDMNRVTLLRKRQQYGLQG